MKDPYKVLGVAKDAKDADIKKAYRRLARELHPDLHPDDKEAEEKFKDVSAAYELLKDPETRARYDRGEIDAEGREKPERHFYKTYADAGAGDRYTYEFGEGGAGMEDILSELFGARGRRAKVKMRGADASYSLRVSFLDAARGAKRRITMPDGRTLDITIPKGTRDRQSLRLKGQGMPGLHGGPAGDAYVEIHIEPHPFFRRKDNDIHVNLPVTLKEAVLGAKVRVPTVDGPVSLTIPEGSNTGDVLRLKGKGVADPKLGRGDQYVHLQVVLPEKPDKELRAFLKGWKPADKTDPRVKAGMA